MSWLQRDNNIRYTLYGQRELATYNFRHFVWSIAAMLDVFTDRLFNKILKTQDVYWDIHSKQTRGQSVECMWLIVNLLACF